MIDHILKYFPNLSAKQKEQFEILMKLYPEWNNKINVISRKDIENLEVNHLLHSLAIAKFIEFQPLTHILDFGSGGGFPGIPLAILFPDTHFHLIDRIGKKMKVASKIASEAGLTNVTTQHGDIGECHLKADFAVSRAVMPQDKQVRLLRKNILSESKHAIPNGVITLKGGNIEAELAGIKQKTEIIPVKQYFDEEFFDTKQIIYTCV